MKYTIMHINDRAKKQMLRNKNNLKSFEYLSDIVFFNANKKNAKDEIIARGISVDTWNPYDEREFLALPGEYGHWISTLNVLEYIVKNKILNLLVLEDDARLVNSAEKKIINAFNDLPKNWDFLSLHYNKDQNKKSKETETNSKIIHKSFNQFSSTVAIIYSYFGAQKILDLVKKFGIEYTTDCFIYEKSRLGLLNGYSILPEIEKFVYHDYPVKSTIDYKNIRNS